MKKYVFVSILITFAIIATYTFAAETTMVVSKIALKYQGESDYRIYDITSANMVFNPSSNTASYGPGFIATLTDESNGLPSGLITEVKFYGTIAGLFTNKWLGLATGYDTPGEALNVFGSNIDLSINKRKKATGRIYGGQGAGNDIGIATPIEENL